MNFMVLTHVLVLTFVMVLAGGMVLARVVVLTRDGWGAAEERERQIKRFHFPARSEPQGALRLLVVLYYDYHY